MFAIKRNKAISNGVDSYQMEIDKIIDYTKALGKQTFLRRIGSFLSDPHVTLILDVLNSSLSLLCEKIITIVRIFYKE